MVKVLWGHNIVLCKDLCGNKFFLIDFFTASSVNFCWKLQWIVCIDSLHFGFFAQNVSRHAFPLSLCCKSGKVMLYSRGHQVRSWRAGVPAEFSSNPNSTHLKQLIKVLLGILEISRQVFWGKLELNSAGHRPSRIKFDDPCSTACQDLCHSRGYSTFMKVKS